MMTTTARDLVVPTAVQELLDRLVTGDWDGMEDHLTADVFYDASVPEWRYQYQGAARVVQEYREEWSGRYRWSIVECDAVEADARVALMIEIHGEPIHAGHPPVVCRLSNFLRLEGDRIAEHRFTCCGEWGPEVVRHIAEHAPMVKATTP